jgi:alanine dehydrogenase
MTLLLSRADLESLLDTHACLTTLRQGFAAPPQAIPQQRIGTELPGPGSATVLIPGLIEGVPAYTVKVNAKFPSATPALRGVICLHDLDDGELLALLDSATITAWRTGLSAAIATDVLARHDAATVAVIGAGVQAELTIRGLGALRSWQDLIVSDIDPVRADDFARRHGGTSQPDPVAAADAADIVITATWSRTPILDTARPGTHITSIGADEPGKAELGDDLLATSRVFVDDLGLAVMKGAIGTAGLTGETVAGTLGDVLRGTMPGRRDDTEVTIYSPVGLPWQDLALSWLAYQRADGTGITFDFLRQDPGRGP